MTRIAIIHAAYEPPPEGLVNSKGQVSMKKAMSLVEANLGKTLDMMHEAGQREADIAVTNEDFADIGRYIRHVNEPHIFSEIVSQVESFIKEQLSEIAKEYGMYIAANEYETHHGKIFNTTNLVGRDGLSIGQYRKVHIPSGERFRVQPWKSAPEVFKTDIGNIGFTTCYDILFPEHCRTLALKGADIIIHQTQGFGMSGKSGIQTGEAFIRVRAAENSVYMVVAKNVFGEGGYSCVFDNNGNPVSHLLSPADHVFITDIEPDFDRISEYEFDNYFAGVNSIRTRLLLGREPSVYGALTEMTPLTDARFCNEEEWTAAIHALDTMEPSKREKMHW
jgi:predicted amidohydrolase